MGRFFHKKPQKGMPLSLDGLARGIAAMAYALENMEVVNGRVDWTDFNAPVISFGDDGAGSSPQFIESIKNALLESIGTITSPTHVLCKNADGEVGWVATVTHASQHPS